jgi:DNA-binding IclR family transcriptional regulator
VQDFTGRTVAAIGLSAPVWRLTLQSLQDSSSKLRSAAQRLSAELGRRDAAPVP